MFWRSVSSLPGTLWGLLLLIFYKFHCYSWIGKKPSGVLMNWRTKGWALIKREQIKSEDRNRGKAELCWFCCMWNKLVLFPSELSSLLALWTSFLWKVMSRHKNTETSSACIQHFEEKKVWWFHRCCVCQIAQVSPESAFCSARRNGSQDQFGRHSPLWTQLWVCWLFIW